MIPLDASILHDSSRYRRAHRFSPQDAIVYASVLAHLARGYEQKSYFVSRDRHFDDPDVVGELGGFNCELVRSFDHGREVIERSDFRAGPRLDWQRYLGLGEFAEAGPSALGYMTHGLEEASVTATDKWTV